MAFDINAFSEKYKTTTKTSGFDVESFTKKYSTPSPTSNFNIDSFTSKFGGSKNDTKTSSGLYDIAVQNGLKNQADRVLNSQKGEETKKIFSGGTISDIFDVLNAAQYGVVGLLKGKTFNEGVKTRQSFTDKDALGDKGIPGIVAGTLLDIAFDPLTYIAPATVIKRIPYATKLIKATKELALGKKVTKTIEGTDKTFQAVEGGTRLGKYLSSKFVYMQGADPVFREMFERGSKNIAVSTDAIVKTTKHVANILPETAGKLLKRDETGRFIRTPLSELEKVLKPEEFEPVAKLYNTIDNLGKEAVDLGLLSKSKFEENIGEYIKNAYTEYETATKKNIFGFTRTGIKGIKNRLEGLTPEEMAKLGQIDNPAYLLFKSAFDLTKDVENAKLFRAVSDKFATNTAQEGFTKLPEGIRLGQLSGKYIPNNMADYLKEIIEPAEKTIAKNLVANFKFFKVVMNPGTHARNIVSNKILNYWKLGINPLDPRAIRNDAIALGEIAKGTGKWSDEARPLGYNLNTFASQEMKTLLDSPEASIMNKTGNLWKTTKQKLGDIYQAEENHAKLSAYIWNRTTKKLNPEDAWKAAESATFNYAQVTPFIRKLRESLFGFPFITFTVKSTPVVLETLLKNPNRVSVIGKIKNSIENLSDIKTTDKERASEPSWVRDGFYIKLPIKDKEGRSSYFDLTYILPFGDLISGNFFERGQDLQTGLPESQVTSAMKKSPFIQLVRDIGRNENFYGNSIWKESDPSEKQLKDLMTYLTKTMAPPLLGEQLHNGYNPRTGEKDFRGITGAKEASSENVKRNLSQELLRNAGIKIQPIDADIQETYQDWNKKKGLETLLRENGILKELNIKYLPK